jgi:predicted outer membrane protein
VELAALGTESTRLSQLAAQRAAHAEVRDFAGQVTHASQALVEEIDRLAAAKNVTIRPETAHAGPEERPAGSAFDEDYLRRTRRIHEDAIAALEEYTRSGEADPHLITLAEQHLPGLHRHLREAEELDDQLARSRSPRPDDLIAGEPPTATAAHHPPLMLARH